MLDRLTFPITTDGLIVEAHIGLPAPLLQTKLAIGKPFVSFVNVRALIDTGADATSVAPIVIAKLQLAASGQAQMITASGTVSVNRHEISLSIFGNAGIAGPSLILPVLNVTSFIKPLHPIEALIGMDLLRQISLNINGPGGTFTLEF